MVKVLFVCLGNICRSPMAEFILKDMVHKKGLEDQFTISSRATSGYNEMHKESMYIDALEILKEMHIPVTDHVSKQLKKEDYQKYDYILGMDDENITNIFKIIGQDPERKVYKLLDFTEEPRDIVDPWYYHNFDTTYYDIEYGCQKFLEFLSSKDSI